MNFLTNIFHILGTGATAYTLARYFRDPLTRPDILANFYLAESNSIPFLEMLRERAVREEDEWLVEQLTRHVADEKKHSQIFGQALKKLDQQVIDLTNIPKEQRRNPFFEAYFDGYSDEELAPLQIDWIVFAGSTYILELDAGKDFALLAQVLPENEAGNCALSKGMMSIAKDETRHAAYLYEILSRRLQAAKVEAVIEEWRTRKVKAMWAMVGNFLENGGKKLSWLTEGVAN